MATPQNRSGAINVFPPVLPLVNMLNTVPTVALPDALKCIFADPALPPCVHHDTRAPTSDEVCELTDGILEMASQSGLLPLLPPTHDGVPAVHYVAALISYTLESPYRIYLAVTNLTLDSVVPASLIA